MSTTESEWQDVADEMTERMLDGQGDRKAEVSQPSIRVRGGGHILPPFRRTTATVLVEVGANGERPDEPAIRLWLPERTRHAALDIYFLLAGCHWASLGPRDLNPMDEEVGGEHLRMLHNLRPDLVVLRSHRPGPLQATEQSLRFSRLMETWESREDVTVVAATNTHPGPSSEVL